MKEFIYITDIHQINGKDAAYIVRRQDIISVGVNKDGFTMVVIRQMPGIGDTGRLFDEKVEVQESVADIYRQLS